MAHANRFVFALAVVIATAAVLARAPDARGDENGVATVGGKTCSSDAMSSIAFICDKLKVMVEAARALRSS